jgi:hypothetical protein
VRFRAAFARRASAPKAASLAAAFVAFTALISAQGGGKPATGNPTPGTAQPDPPNVADRVTFGGCLQRAARNAASSSATPGDPNAPSNLRFELTNAEPKADSPPATSASSKSYRLEGIDSIFSPFVGSTVEITGAIKPPSKAEKGASPTLVVEFLQRIAAKCS